MAARVGRAVFVLSRRRGEAGVVYHPEVVRSEMFCRLGTAEEGSPGSDALARSRRRPPSWRSAVSVAAAAGAGSPWRLKRQLRYMYVVAGTSAAKNRCNADCSSAAAIDSVDIFFVAKMRAARPQVGDTKMNRLTQNSPCYRRCRSRYRQLKFRLGDAPTLRGLSG